MLKILCQAIGAFVIARLAYQFANFVNFYFIPRSTIQTYLREDGEAYALITGATDGIGLALTRVLLSKGFNILMMSRSEEKLNRIAGQFRAEFPQRTIQIVAADARRPESAVPAVAAAVGRLERQGGKLCLLVNNLGGQAPTMFNAPTYQAFHERDLEAVTHSFNLNARFPLQLTRVLMPNLASSAEGPAKGLVINLGSFAGVHAIPFISPYGSSKAFLHHWTRVLAVECKLTNYPIDVLGIVIGEVKTTGNGAEATSFTCPSAEEMARSITDRVGCGRDLVVGSWRHALSGALIEIMPEGIVQNIMNSSIRRLQRREQERIAKAK